MDREGQKPLKRGKAGEETQGEFSPDPVTFQAAGKEVCIRACRSAVSPVSGRAPTGGEEPGLPEIYLTGDEGEGEAVYASLLNIPHPPFVLVSIGGLDWNRDMAPWDSPAISKKGSPFTGGADAYLSLMTEEILPQTEMRLRDLWDGKEERMVSWRGLAGYSLAGLFAVYALYRSDVFSRIASCSGSLWYPHFYEFALNEERKVRPEKVYLSLGDKESATRNPAMKPVQENTEKLAGAFRAEGIETVFELNPGGHFMDAPGRIAKGIVNLLERP